MKARAVGAFVIFLVILTSPFIVNAAMGHLGSAATEPQLSDNCAEGDSNCLQLPTAEAVANWNGTSVSQVGDNPVCAISGDKTYVRLNHPSLLMEERTNHVRLDVSNRNNSLKECFKCHEDKKTFCDRCHDYSGVTPTCFGKTGGCHNDQGEV